MELLYVTYYTSSEAIATELICKSENINGKLVSVPRELSSGCGMAFETAKENENHIKEVLDKNDIEYENISLLKR